MTTGKSPPHPEKIPHNKIGKINVTLSILQLHQSTYQYHTESFKKFYTLSPKKAYTFFFNIYNDLELAIISLMSFGQVT